jgi:hypothetical protein
VERFVFVDTSTSVQVPAAPICVLQQVFTIFNQSQVITNTFGRRFPGGRLVNFTSLLVNEAMNTAGTTTINKDDLVILFASLYLIINRTNTRLEFINLAR